MAEAHREDSEPGPTYKSIAYAACGVVFTLVGWWVTDIKQSVSRVFEHLEKHDGRLTTLEAGKIEHKYEHHQLDQRLDRVENTVEANTKILRDMERSTPRR